MATGLELRAQMDMETVKALILANGGGAVAAIHALPDLADAYGLLAVPMIVGTVGFAAGLLLAVGSNYSRRMCSLIHEQHKRLDGSMVPPPTRWCGIEVWHQSFSCLVGHLTLWASALCFVWAVVYIARWGVPVLMAGAAGG